MEWWNERFRFHPLVVVLVFVLSGGLLFWAIRTSAGQERRSGKSPPTALIAHGKYLVDRVAMCGDCHTPRLSSGAPDASQYLQGADLDFKPVHPVPNWAERAPDITAEGLKEYTVESLTKVLKGQTDANGQSVPLFKPPMPTYRLNDYDAKAVATYLKSVSSKQ
jgi:mono/diheme cytochrome c family protein